MSEPKYKFMFADGNKLVKRVPISLPVKLVDYVKSVGKRNNRKLSWQFAHIVEQWATDHPEEAKV